MSAKLEAWRDLKFGLLMHWGLYSVRGIVESWSLCAEDQPWCDRGGADYDTYVREYHDLIERFDPQEFDPTPWARAARDSGMGYVVFPGNVGDEDGLAQLTI